MVDTKKGSALPRGLSSSDKVYLAPVAGKDISALKVAVRFEDGRFMLSNHALAEIEDWAAQEDLIQNRLLQQISYLKDYAAQMTVWGHDEPLIMGIVNVTPDSFSDGGRFFHSDEAEQQAKKLLEDGATILDIGGESTRPGADPVGLDEEKARVIPVIEALRERDVLLSIDTRKAPVMDAAIEAGADIVNDVTALDYDRESLPIVAKSSAKVCLMHSAADPKVMQDNPTYDHVLFDVYDYLEGRIEACIQADISRQRLSIDPGIGFGKTLAHNLALLKGLGFFHSLGCPLLLGVSRKSFIGRLDRDGEANQRIGGSLSALLYGYAAGVQIFRVHDVAETRQALAVWEHIEKTGLKD